MTYLLGLGKTTDVLDDDVDTDRPVAHTSHGCGPTYLGARFSLVVVGGGGGRRRGRRRGYAGN